MRVIQGFLRIYGNAMYGLAVVSVLGILLTVSLQVVARYVFGASFRWSEELSRYLLVWITFIFAGTALSRGEMIALELLGALQGWKRVVVYVLGAGPALAALSVMIYYGYRYASMNAAQTSPTLGISMYYLYLALPVGIGLMSVHFLAQIATVALAEIRGAEAP